MPLGSISLGRGSSLRRVGGIGLVGGWVDVSPREIEPFAGGNSAYVGHVSYMDNGTIYKFSSISFHACKCMERVALSLANSCVYSAKKASGDVINRR